MVNQVVVLSGTYSQDATEEQLDSISPASGEQVRTVAYYTDGDSETEYSLTLEEQTLIDRLDGDLAPSEAEPHQLDIELQSGDELALSATDLNSTSTSVTLILLVENTNLPQAQG